MKQEKQSLDEMISTLQQSTGIHNRLVAERMVCEVYEVLVSPKETDEDVDVDQFLATATSLLKEMAPQNVIEGMLVTQMIATHDAALKFIKLATLDHKPSGTDRT